LTVSNNNTDDWFHPVAAACGIDGVAIVGLGMPIIINDQVTVTIAQADNDDGVTATIIYEM
jgi:hypothetical protein